MTTRTINGTQRSVVFAFLLALSVSSAVLAQEHGHGEGGFAGHGSPERGGVEHGSPERGGLEHGNAEHGGFARGGLEHGEHQHIDTHFSHNHYYFDHGYRVHEAPQSGHEIQHEHEHFWYDRGQWYRRDGRGWLVVGAPVGAFVTDLPPFTPQSGSVECPTTTPTTRTTPGAAITTSTRWWSRRPGLKTRARPRRQPLTQYSSIPRTASPPSSRRVIAMNATIRPWSRPATTRRRRAAVCHLQLQRANGATTSEPRRPASTRTATAYGSRSALKFKGGVPKKGTHMKIQRVIALGVLLAGAGTHSAGAAPAVPAIATSAETPDQGIDRAAAGDEDPAAVYDLGRKFDEGLGVAADERQAFQWYSRAAARGHAESMNRLGILYSQGRGVPQDYVAALAWYQQAAARGSLTAVSNVATLYFYGLGVPQSYPKAARLLEVAAQQGAADAQNKLGAMYNDGLGVAQDQRKARDLFRQSAGQGYPPAMVNLGRMYTEAIGGERDEIRGFAWIQAAINVGVPA